MKNSHGFTLIELLVVLVIIAIFSAIAIPSYKQYMQKKDLDLAKQEALRISGELERFKGKNFSYKGFDASFAYPNYNSATGELLLPIGSTSANAKYILTLVDSGDQKKPLTILSNAGNETPDSQAVRGLGWAIKVERIQERGEPKDPKNFDLLLLSSGLKCMSITKNRFDQYACNPTWVDVETW
ncbi:type IV pilin protein [Acinetobacter courvalinii]|uniref:type IV pilin protein n=1 Tax=Acinetobacter courvalinii TaxID=280147 RepID=UPI003A8B6712